LLNIIRNVKKSEYFKLFLVVRLACKGLLTPANPDNSCSIHLFPKISFGWDFSDKAVGVLHVVLYVTSKVKYKNFEEVMG